MLRLNPAPTFSSSVRLSMPGGQASAEVTVTWRHKGRAALAEWLAKPATLHQQGLPLSDVDYLAEVIDSIDGLGDADGTPLAYSVDALRTLLDQYHPAAQELFDAYRPALEAAVEKNAVGSPAG